MAGLPVDDHLDKSVPSSPIRRLLEARALLIVLGVLFVLFSTRWTDSASILVAAYGLVCGVIAFSRRKGESRRMVKLKNQAKHAPIWPDTQAKLIVDAIPAPSVILDGKAIVRHINEPMRDAFGAILQGDPLTYKFRNPDVSQALAEVRATGRIITLAYMERFPSERHYLIYFSPVHLPDRSGEKMGPDFILVILLDQTERFRAEELRSDFIANVSHELRTPLASLTGFIETLLGPAQNDAKSRERFLQIMLEQSQRMARLVSDLLSLSGIEMRSHLKPTHEVDLTVVARHVADAMAPLAEEAKLTIHLHMPDGPLLVRGERDELIQVVQNLAENAIKYGADGEHIDIRVNEVAAPADFNAKGAPCYVIDVQDYGKGVASEHLPRLTERFYRVDAEESKAKMGTGLGLAVVKHILTRHKGQLKITSEPGKGARFKVYLPKSEDFR